MRYTNLQCKGTRVNIKYSDTPAMSINATSNSSATASLCLYSTDQELEDNVEYSERMSEVIPINYALWKVGFLLLFMLATTYAFKEIFQYLKFNKVTLGDNFKWKDFIYQPKHASIMGILIACFMRLLWLLDPHERSVAFWGHIYGARRQERTPTEFLLKVPQVLLMTIVLFQIKVWREVVKKAKYVTRKRRVKSEIGKDMQRMSLEDKVITGLAFSLLSIGLSSAFLYAANIVDISNVANIIFGLYSLALCIGGAYYSIQLQKIIHQMLESDHKSLALKGIQRIRLAVIIMLSACVFLISAIAWRIFIDPCKKPDQIDQNTQYLWFITFVHGCECIVAASLLYTLKNRKTGSEKKVVEHQNSVGVSASTATPETSTNKYIANDDGGKA